LDQEFIENRLVKKFESEGKFDKSNDNTEINQVKLSEEEIRLIAEVVANTLREEYSNEPRSEVLEDYFRILEPKQKVIDQKEFSVGVRIAGWIILSLCIWYWIYFFFIAKIYEPLTYTTYITIILVALTCINKFESVLLNSITCLTFYGFIAISCWLIPVSTTLPKWLGGPILHFAIGFFQLFLVFNKRIPVSKRYLIYGFLFYTLFLSSYDQFSRLTIMTGQEDRFTDVFQAVHFFYTLALSLIFVYWYKKRFGILLP